MYLHYIRVNLWTGIFATTITGWHRVAIHNFIFAYGDALGYEIVRTESIKATSMEKDRAVVHKWRENEANRNMVYLCHKIYVNTYDL